MQMKRHADAEDVAQEVFVRLLKYEPQFENKEHEKAWFVKATVNLCRDIMKSKWNSTTVSIEKIPEQGNRAAAWNAGKYGKNKFEEGQGSPEKKVGGLR